jgi:sugar phosphate isomerase/epimerase
MIKSGVTIALVPELKTGPWIFWENLEKSISKAANLGFDGVELFTVAANACPPDKLAELLQKYAIKLAAVGTGAGKVIRGLTLTNPDPAIRNEAAAFISDMISFGAPFGAPAIIGSMQGNVQPGTEREQAFAWLVQGLNQLGKHAENQGVNLIYEPLNRYETNLANTLSAGAELVDLLDTRNVKLLADLFHMNIEEESLPGSILTFGAYIGHVHFADSNRRPVGGGHTPMPEIAAALREIGYSGYVSAEAFPWPDPDAAAAQTMVAFKQYFRE